MREVWTKWQALGWIQPVDAMMGRYLLKWMSQSGDAHADVIASLAVVLSRASAFGHACVPLDALWPEELRMMREFFPPSERLIEMALGSRWVHNSTAVVINREAPLWLSPGKKCYLKRFAMYEQTIATWFSGQCDRRFPCDAQAVKCILDALFGEASVSSQEAVAEVDAIDWQRVSVSIAMRFPLTVLAGGPGTGKTTTVVKLLAALQALSTTPLDIVVAAPTGKAAARLTDSIRHQRDQLAISEVIKAAIPQSTHTVHRLLQWNPSQQCFGRNQETPLNADVVIIDEASMLDLYMAQALLRALKPDARLILLGDSNQLPAVESGAVFQHLSAFAMQRPSQEHVHWLTVTHCAPSTLSVHDLVGRVGTTGVTLLDSYRFDEASDLGAVAQAVLHGDSRKAVDQVEQSHWFVERADLLTCAMQRWEPIPQQSTVSGALEVFQRFRLLAPSRKAVMHINAAIQAYFNPRGDSFYRGQPIMVVVNDYRRMLFNGDVGIVWPDHEGKLVAWFWIDGALQSFALQGLPTWQTCYAMTVHKSQGSEFEEVGIVFPEREGATLTRQWLYTAITRAKSKVLFTRSIEYFVGAVESVMTRETDFSALLPAFTEASTSAHDLEAAIV